MIRNGVTGPYPYTTPIPIIYDVNEGIIQARQKMSEGLVMVIGGVSSIIQEYIELRKSGRVYLVTIAFDETRVVFSFVSCEIGDELLFWTTELAPVVDAYHGGLISTHR